MRQLSLVPSVSLLNRVVGVDKASHLHGGRKSAAGAPLKRRGAAPLPQRRPAGVRRGEGREQPPRGVPAKAACGCGAQKGYASGASPCSCSSHRSEVAE